jgi:hypothetical protein
MCLTAVAIIGDTYGKIDCLVGRNSYSVLRHSGDKHPAQYGYRLLRPTDCILRVDVRYTLKAGGLFTSAEWAIAANAARKAEKIKPPYSRAPVERTVRLTYVH